MYEEKYNITDLVSNSRMDMMHICKRKNNTKRDFLFVNKYQGKHVPVLANEVYKSVKQLYDLSYVYLKDKKDILVVGFAETATGMAETFFEYATYRNTGLNVKGFITTTREKVSGKEQKAIYFDELHSHAVSQHIYLSKEDLSNISTVVFIEDEISTGNTILNCVNQFNQLLGGVIGSIDYYVVSFCNWQTEEARKAFDKAHIVPIALHTGELTNLDIQLEVEEDELKDYTTDIICKDLISEGEYDSVRIGVKDSRNAFIAGSVGRKIVDKYLSDENIEVVEVVGTEEFMGFPLCVANTLCSHGYKAYFHATTRSPITVSKDTIISDGVKLHSAYDENRETYLYDLDKICPDKVFVFVEGNPTKEFINDIIYIYMNQGMSLKDIHMVCV